MSLHFEHLTELAIVAALHDGGEFVAFISQIKIYAVALTRHVGYWYQTRQLLHPRPLGGELRVQVEVGLGNFFSLLCKVV